MIADVVELRVLVGALIRGLDDYSLGNLELYEECLREAMRIIEVEHQAVKERL